jgi:hypothetical protein
MLLDALRFSFAVSSDGESLGEETTATQTISCFESFFFAFNGYLVTYDQFRQMQRGRRSNLFRTMNNTDASQLTSVCMSSHSATRE